MRKLWILLLAALLLGGCEINSTDTPTATTVRVTTTTVPTTTTAPTTTTTIAPTRVAVKKATRAAVAPRPAVGGDIWRALANCESALGNDSRNGKYHGYFQFSLSTWYSLGETGDPHTYSYEHQKAAAQRLQARSGWGQWPICSRKLGLR